MSQKSEIVATYNNKTDFSGGGIIILDDDANMAFITPHHRSADDNNIDCRKGSASAILWAI